jgi:hypothetical protein
MRRLDRLLFAVAMAILSSPFFSTLLLAIPKEPP